MNLLQLVNRARLECGVTSGDLTTVQSGLSSEGQRFVNWVGNGWNDIQLARPDWQWMRKNVTFNTVVGQGTYTFAQAGATDCAEWLRESFRDYLTSVGVNGEQYMTYREYNNFRDLYQFGAMRNTQSRPIEITVQPDHSLAIWPLPNAIYTITGEYYRIPSTLALDTDDPSTVGNDMPTRFHLLIVAKAMRAYAAYEAAPEVDERGADMERRLMGQLEAWGWPAPSMGGALC